MFRDGEKKKKKKEKKAILIIRFTTNLKTRPSMVATLTKPRRISIHPVDSGKPVFCPSLEAVGKDTREKGAELGSAVIGKTRFIAAANLLGFKRLIAGSRTAAVTFLRPSRVTPQKY